MAQFKLEIINNGKRFPKLILQHKESEEQFKLIGGVKLDNSDKVALEGLEDPSNKVVCSIETLEKNYTHIGYYDEEETNS